VDRHCRGRNGGRPGRQLGHLLRLAVAAIGRLKAGPERELVARYATRIEKGARPLGVSGLDQIELAESRASNTNLRKREEAEALSKRLSAFPTRIVFDERGKAIDSVTFANMVRTAIDVGENVACVIGGPDGLAEGMREQGTNVISFGRLTLPHQLVRVLVFEQLYRATTILAGHPYHRI